MIEYGFCMICGKEIAPKYENIRKPGSQYTEVEVTWSNNCKMRVAVCVDCAVKNAHADPESKAKITKAHQDHWTESGGTFDKEIVLV